MNTDRTSKERYEIFELSIAFVIRDFPFFLFKIFKSISKLIFFLVEMINSSIFLFDFRYLTQALDEKFIRKQDFATLLMKIALNPMGLDVAWNFVK